MIPFSLMWGGFAIFWELGVTTEGAPLFFRLWGIPFVVFGLYLIFGRFIVDAWQRSKTFYGVTDDRAIIVSGLFARDVKSLNLSTLSDVSLSERSDGSGSITFGPESPLAWWGGASWPGYGQQTPRFELIRDARSVYEIIRDAQRRA